MQTAQNLSQIGGAAPLTEGNAPYVIGRDLFASPVLLCEWPQTQALNAALRDVIMERYRVAPSTIQSARYAWQSEFDFHKWPHKCVEEFVDMLKVSAAKFTAYILPNAPKELTEGWRIVSCFANVNPPGGFSQPHNHIETGALISGVYYVDIGECEPPYAGRTILQDRSGVAFPRAAGRDPLACEYAVVPRPGAALLFTAAQMHYVEPYRGKGLRISIAFNLSHPAFDVHYYPGMRTETWWWRNFRGFMLVGRKVPELWRALRMFGTYFARELRRPSGQSVFQKAKVALQRAEVDAQADLGATTVGDGHLRQKNIFR